MALRYCNCEQCGKHMIVVWDDDDKHYYAVCEDCKRVAPLKLDGDNPPRAQ